MPSPKRKPSRESRRAAEQRRNERAQALGYRNRYDMRKALRRGEFVPTRDKRGTITGRSLGPSLPDWAKAGYSSPAIYAQERRQSREWSRRHSRQETSRYRASFTPEQTASYHRALVDPDTKYAYAQYDDERREFLRHHLVDVMHYMTNEEFDARY